MSFSLYKQQEETTELRIDAKLKSPAYTSRYFELTPCESSKSRTNVKIYGIAEDAPSLQYSTTWEDGPTTTFTKKFTDMTDNNFIKTFAQRNKDYQPIIATDSWTQQYPKSGAIVKVPLKFRTYFESINDTVSYINCLPALFKYTTPQQFHFSSEIKLLKQAMEGAKEVGVNFGDIIKNVNSSIQNILKEEDQTKNGLGQIKWQTIVDKLKKIQTEVKPGVNIRKYIDEVEQETTKDFEDKKISADVRIVTNGFVSLIALLQTITAANDPGCQTFTLKYGNLYKPTYNEWVIDSWSFTPSINTTYNDLPLYVDINLTVRTAAFIGTGDMKKLIS